MRSTLLTWVFALLLIVIAYKYSGELNKSACLLAQRNAYIDRCNVLAAYHNERCPREERVQADAGKLIAWAAVNPDPSRPVIPVGYIALGNEGRDMRPGTLADAEELNNKDK